MNILIVSLYFRPDHTGIANYAGGFATAAARNGHNVQVITGFPFYPQWRKQKQDRLKFFRSDKDGNVKVLRSYLYVPSKPNTIKRILQELSFLAFATPGLLRVKKPEIIVCFTTPILLGFWSSIVSRIFRAKLIINVQDFQLEAALSLGMAKKSGVTRILEWFEKRSYKRADYVCSITSSMCEILTKKKNVPIEKTILWPNWINMGDYDLSPIQTYTFRRQHQIDKETLLVCYAGNIGLKQGMESLLEIVAKVGGVRKLLFLIVGNGAALPHLKGLVQENNLTAMVKFLPLLSAKEYLTLLKDIDIFVLPQKKTAFDVYFPSKLMGILIGKVPLLLLADKESELFKTVSQKNAGTCFEFGDTDGASAFIRDFDANKSEIKAKIEDGFRFACDFDEQKVISEILNMVNDEN
ncbi:MAG: colanic acid biosynthesis glycosyltransferase WcaI [Chitinophagaceae bacterium]|nr:MAG: colanic acid biosynthesis glycosyltransferase WcaI [Chitinophagaceae bacterium]